MAKTKGPSRTERPQGDVATLTPQDLKRAVRRVHGYLAPYRPTLTQSEQFLRLTQMIEGYPFTSRDKADSRTEDHARRSGVNRNFSRGEAGRG